MLAINQLTYQYQQAWFSFDLQVERGSITALMGPSGAGKSTLLSLLAGFIAPHSGDIWVDGQSILAKVPYQRPFSMLFQEHNLFSHLSVRENIALGLHPGLKLNVQQKDQVQWAAQQVGIEPFLDRLPEQLSGGQRQRVALARCFVQSHPIWLLDEPFSALDPLLREEMLQLVKSLAQARNITVLMVTHHLNDAKTIASHFAFMDQGKVEVVGDVSTLSEPQNHPAFADFIRAGS